jgi:DNA-binding NtrC family response regulator
MNNNLIIIIDDDNDDLELIKEAFADLKVENEIITFDNGKDFLNYIKGTDKGVFFILCDINMSTISGMELKKITFEDDRLRLKCMPFIFISTSRASESVMRAYSFGVQGYFVKPNTYETLKVMLQNMISYWEFSLRPNV